MSIGKRNWWLLYLVAFSFFLFVVFGFVKYATNKPPAEELKQARRALASAKNYKAGKYAPEVLEQAEVLYGQAMEEWKVQNEKFFLFRDYSQVEEWAAKSEYKSKMAEQEAKTFQTNLVNTIEFELDEVKEKVERFEKYFKNLPLNKLTFGFYSKSTQQFFEAKYNFEKGELKQAQMKLKLAAENINKAEKAAAVKLSDFYESYPIWEKNTKLAYSLSKKGQTVFLVDKMNGTLHVLKSGKEHAVYLTEFGRNWMGDKMKQGDYATPEGVYKVISKKSGSNTKYYRALELNYPNPNDKIRFENLKEEGKIGKQEKIGGLIEIHGEGGKGVNWTEGCIALENNDMNAVYKLSSVNTPVIIVGAVKTIQEYLE